MIKEEREVKTVYVREWMNESSEWMSEWVNKSLPIMILSIIIFIAKKTQAKHFFPSDSDILIQFLNFTPRQQQEKNTAEKIHEKKEENKKKKI